MRRKLIIFVVGVSLILAVLLTGSKRNGEQSKPAAEKPAPAVSAAEAALYSAPSVPVENPAAAEEPPMVKKPPADLDPDVRRKQEAVLFVLMILLV